MENMTLGDVAAACNGRYQGPPALLGRQVADIVRDHRTAGPGKIFTAFAGEHADGHDFIRAALDAGALAAMGWRDLPQAEPYIRVADCAQAWGDIARAYRARFSLPLIAVTGSVGKTTTKDMIAAVLEQKYRVLKSEGNHNNHLGLPLTLFQLSGEHEMAVLELGISDFGEMRHLAAIAQPTAAVYTNIGDAHLEDLGSRAGVLRAKAELLEFLPPEGKLFLNGDDDQLSSLKAGKDKLPPIVRYGLDGANDFYIRSWEEDAEGMTVEVKHKKGRLELFLPEHGRHLLYGVLAATAVGLSYGLTPSEIRAGLSGFKPLPGHGNLIDTGYIRIVDHSYNANPSSVKAALDALSGMRGRKVAILGDMYGLGELAEEKHHEVCRHMSKLPIWVLICVGELGKHFFGGAMRYASSHDLYYCVDVEHAIRKLEEIIRPEDNVLVKASHAMGFGRIVAALENLGQERG